MGDMADDYTWGGRFDRTPDPEPWMDSGDYEVKSDDVEPVDFTNLTNEDE